MQVINPATGDIVGTVPADSATDVAQKFASAKEAQSAWAGRSLAERIQIIRRFAELLQSERDTLGRQLSLEMGKPLAQATGEIKGTDARIQFFLKNAPHVLGEEAVQGDASTAERISWEPLGVIVNISAWNYPYFVGVNVIVPALLTGNAVLYKASEFTALTGASIARIMHEAGVPEDVFQAVHGGPDTGAALLDPAHPLDGLFFTGSYRTGRHLHQALAGRLKKVQLELGGKDPAYFADDVVDVSAAAAAGVEGAFYNAGQSCCAVERIYVHAHIYDAFVEAFIENVKNMKVGDPLQEGTDIGPLAREAQLDVLAAQVEDALSKGARLQIGGERMRVAGHGYFFSPTVLTHVNHSMAVMREETFGPVIGIQKVSDDEEALRLMNDTEYGLTAAVYSATQERAAAILREVNSGTVYWNCCDRISPRLPWTGRGMSGMGSTLSLMGIRAFVQPKAWHLREP